MRSHGRLRLILAALVATAISCSDDSTPTGGDDGTTLQPPKVVSVTPFDAFNLDVLFDKAVLRESAEDADNYLITKSAPSPASAFGPSALAPGDTIRIQNVSLRTDGRTAAISTSDTMSVVSYRITVSDVLDTHGNRMTTASVRSFTGKSNLDQTPPSIVFQSPDPSATGVGIAEPIVVRFSEPVRRGTVIEGLSWSSQGGEVLREAFTEDDVSYMIIPLETLALNTLYTVQFSGVVDFANPANMMTTTSWSFTTTNVPDTDPPTLDRSTPRNGATNVSVNTNLSLTFSEPVNQVQFEVLLTPAVGDGIAVWSTDGTTITFDPDFPLSDNTTYNLLMIPGAVRDLSGNKIEEPVLVQFTTGGGFSIGAITGTLAGDPQSDFAGDPTGTYVIATDAPPSVDDFGIYAFDVVAGDDTYRLDRLADRIYFLMGVLDSNSDGELDPDHGDAVGGYGIDFATGDLDPLPVLVGGGATVPGIDFPLYDPSAVRGTVAYSGTEFGHYFYVGLFDTTGFSPANDPDFQTREFWPDHTVWSVNEFDDDLSDGTYYIGAFLDINNNDAWDPATEPAGFFGGAVPTPVTIENGGDRLDIDIVLLDPIAAQLPMKSWRWNGNDHTSQFSRLSDAIRRAINGRASTH